MTPRRCRFRPAAVADGRLGAEVLLAPAYTMQNTHKTPQPVARPQGIRGTWSGHGKGRGGPGLKMFKMLEATRFNILNILSGGPGQALKCLNCWKRPISTF